jgi:hypothetical protein
MRLLTFAFVACGVAAALRKYTRAVAHPPGLSLMSTSCDLPVHSLISTNKVTLRDALTLLSKNQNSCIELQLPHKAVLFGLREAATFWIQPELLSLSEYIHLGQSNTPVVSTDVPMEQLIRLLAAHEYVRLQARGVLSRHGMLRWMYDHCIKGEQLGRLNVPQVHIGKVEGLIRIPALLALERDTPAREAFASMLTTDTRSVLLVHKNKGSESLASHVAPESVTGVASLSDLKAMLHLKRDALELPIAEFVAKSRTLRQRHHGVIEVYAVDDAMTWYDVLSVMISKQVHNVFVYKDDRFVGVVTAETMLQSLCR